MYGGLVYAHDELEHRYTGQSKHSRREDRDTMKQTWQSKFNLVYVETCCCISHYSITCCPFAP